MIKGLFSEEMRAVFLQSEIAFACRLSSREMIFAAKFTKQGFNITSL
jgi:hypothetical protein